MDTFDIPAVPYIDRWGPPSKGVRAEVDDPQTVLGRGPNGREVLAKGREAKVIEYLVNDRRPVSVLRASTATGLSQEAVSAALRSISKLLFKDTTMAQPGNVEELRDKVREIRWTEARVDIRTARLPAGASPARQPKAKRSLQLVPPLIRDELMPDPYTARNLTGLRQKLAELVDYAGPYSSRQLADASMCPHTEEKAFSHATAARLIAANPTVQLNVVVVTGLVRGCGGDEAEQARWVHAYRQLKADKRARPIHAAES